MRCSFPAPRTILASYPTDAVAQQHQDPKSLWSIDNTGLLPHHGLIYVPEPLCMDVSQQHHDAPLAGHPGVFKTIKLLTRNYWLIKLPSSSPPHVTVGF